MILKTKTQNTVVSFLVIVCLLFPENNLTSFRIESSWKELFAFSLNGHLWQVCFSNLDQGSKIIIFESIWINCDTFIASIIYRGCWGSSKNWLELKIEPLLANLACLNWWNTLYSLIIFLVNFDHFYSEHHLQRLLGNSKNWLELKIEPLLANLAFLNRRNTLYSLIIFLVNFDHFYSEHRFYRPVG